MRYIKQFQKENNLIQDGIIGKYTIKKMMEVFNIKNKHHIAHFLGQIAEETGNFSKSTESLNYSARRLRQIFNRYYSNYDESIVAARNPEMIANRVYMDVNRIVPLGNTQKGDGWKFIGRGAIQITGRDRYKEFAKYINDFRILNDPSIVAKLYFWETALWFFNTRNVWKHCGNVSTRQIKVVTKVINGGYNGVEHRINLTRHFYDVAKTIK